MKTTVTVSFDREPLSAITDRRRFNYEGHVTLPEIGDVIHNPTAGNPDQPLSGRLVKRQFSFHADGVRVILVAHGEMFAQPK